VLVSLAGEAIAPVAGQPAPGFYLDAGSRRLTGWDGCNRVLAGYTLEGATIRFSQRASTMMACSQDVDTAQRYARVLAETLHWRVLGRQLELYDSGDRLLARFEVDAAP
jgi:heat shock protein HslJ